MYNSDLIHHAIDHGLIAGWLAVEQSDRIKIILGRSTGELQYFPSECEALSAAALVNLPSSGEKHAARIRDRIPMGDADVAVPIETSSDLDIPR